MGGILKSVSPVAMLANKSDKPAPPKEVAGGGIETIIRNEADASAEKKRKQEQSKTLLGSGGERKVGL